MNLVVGDKVFFISKYTATRVVKGTVDVVNDDSTVVTVKYRDKYGRMARHIIKPQDIIKKQNFNNSGRSTNHTFSLVNIRGQLIVAPIHTQTERKVCVTIGGYKFCYLKSSVITGNIVRS